MGWLLTIPMGAFLLLLGIYWQPDPISRKDRKLQARLDTAQGELPAQSGEKPKLTTEQVRRYLRLTGERVGLIGFGLFAMLVGAIDDLGKPDDSEAVLALFGLYAGMIVVVQRTEQRRKMVTLWLMGIAALLTWGRAESLHVTTEGNWSILAALGANFLFWLLINRRFPPGTSDAIEVYGME